PAPENFYLSLHDALPISLRDKRLDAEFLAALGSQHLGLRIHAKTPLLSRNSVAAQRRASLLSAGDGSERNPGPSPVRRSGPSRKDRKSTRLNSSHVAISS